MSMAISFGRVGIYNEESLNKVTRSIDHVVLQGHLKYFGCYITTMFAKLGKVMTYYKTP